MVYVYVYIHWEKIDNTYICRGTVLLKEWVCEAIPTCWEKIDNIIRTYAEVKEWICEGNVPPPLRSVKLTIIHGLISASKI